MKWSIILSFLLLLISNKNNINCEEEDFGDPDMNRAFACMTIINEIITTRRDIQEDKQQLFQLMLMTCFIKIDEDLVKQIMIESEIGKLSIESSEMQRLVNTDDLKEKYSGKEIRDYSDRLKATLDKMRKLHEESTGETSFSEKDLDDEDDDNVDFTGQNSKLRKLFLKIIKSVNTFSGVLIVVLVGFLIFHIIQNNCRSTVKKTKKKKENKKQEKKQEKEEEEEKDEEKEEEEKEVEKEAEKEEEEKEVEKEAEKEEENKKKEKKENKEKIE